MFYKEKLLGKDQIKFQTCSIAVMGSDTGVGSTHISVSAARYIQLCRKKRVLLLSPDAGRGEGAAFSGMQAVCSGSESNFAKEVQKLRESGIYEYLVIDYGKADTDKRNEFVKQDIRIFVLSFSVWKQDRIQAFLYREQKRIYREWHFVYHFGEPESKRRFERKYGISVHRFPYTEDVWHTDWQVYTFFGTKINLAGGNSVLRLFP